MAVQTGIRETRGMAEAGGPPKSTGSASKPAGNSGSPHQDPRAGIALQGKKFRKGEREVAGGVIQDVNNRRFAKALVELDDWKNYYTELGLQGRPAVLLPPELTTAWSSRRK